MKPIKDKELRELISQKLGALESVNTDHLWDGIESGLPSSSSGFMTGVLKCILFVTSFISVITISDSSGFAKEPTASVHEANYQANNTRTVEVEPESKFSPAIKINEAPNLIAGDAEAQTKVKLGDDHIKPIGKKRPLQFKAYTVESRGIDFVPKAPIPGSLKPRTNVSITYGNQNQLFISVSPYLTFHSMLPNSFDENYVVSSATTSTTFTNRVGVNVSVGYWRAIAKRWLITGSVGVDYYQTQFAYRVANYVDAEVLPKNHRIDGGLSVGVGYRINTPIGQGIVQGESWLRHILHEFNVPSSYGKSIVGYRFSYLIDFAGLQVGPTYSSFFNSMSNEMGQVKPRIFGFTLRKDIR